MDDADLFEQVTISINPEFAGTTFLFPATAMEKTIAPFELADISTEAVAAAAKRTRNTSEYLERTKIVADADQAGEVAITAQDADRVAVESLRQSEAEVRTELIRRVLTTGIVSTDPENRNQLTHRIVPTFMEHAGIEAWTEKAKFSAAEELRGLVVASADGQNFSATIAELIAEGLPVTVIGFHEHAAWAVTDENISFVDLEDIPGVFREPLPRVNLDQLPDEGAWLQPFRPLTSLLKSRNHDQ